MAQTKFTIEVNPVPSGGVAAQITSEQTPTITGLHCNNCIIMADPSNTVPVWVGDYQVTVGTHGVRLEAPANGQVMPFAAFGNSLGNNSINLADIYCLTTASNQVLHVVYFEG